MDPVHERGSQDPVHILMDLRSTEGGPCFILSRRRNKRSIKHVTIALTGGINTNLLMSSQ